MEEGKGRRTLLVSGQDCTVKPLDTDPSSRKKPLRSPKPAPHMWQGWLGPAQLMSLSWLSGGVPGEIGGPFPGASERERERETQRKTVCARV